MVILGGTSGIGLATAKAAAAAGASVVVASRNPASVTSALAELPAGSAGRAVDASSTEELAAFFEFVGDFDHFAYTAAGSLVSTPLAEYTTDKGRAFFELRVVTALDAIRLAVPHIRPGGSITMTSGTAAFRGGAGWFLGPAASRVRERGREGTQARRRRTRGLAVEPQRVGPHRPARSHLHAPFLERSFGVIEPNTSAWRRRTAGDMTSALRLGEHHLRCRRCPM
jgi:NAD(P)-dependent dehydrogenase (short-subunit alcohol dehydrogenase family)